MMSNQFLSVIHGPLLAPGDYPLDWLKTAMDITGAFEGSKQNTVTGNFDGQGISVGILQWNYGQGSLQSKILLPFIQKRGSLELDSFFPTPISQTATMKPAEAISFAKKHMLSGKEIKLQWARAWASFLSLDVIYEIQMDAAASIASRAYQDAVSNNLRSKRAFCWFFDLYVQNGSLKGIAMPEISMAERASRWIKNIWEDPCPPVEYPLPYPVQDQYERNVIKEAGENLNVWLANPCRDDEGIILFNWITLRAPQNRWRQDVISRKGTIAHRIGTVHGKVYDLRRVLS